MREIQPRETPCYCMNFRRMANALTRFYDSRLEPVGLTASQLSLLADIQSIEPCNRTELAKRARLDRTTVVRNLEPLRKKGLIQDDPAIRLTERGLEVMQQGFRLWHEAQKRIGTLFDPETRTALREAFGMVDQVDALMQSEGTIN